MTLADAFEDATACEICGRDACEDHLPEPDVTSRGLRFVSAAEISGAPRPIEIVEGIAWAGCLTALVSESGTGKTFVLLALSAHVSDDVAFHGRAVRPGSVAYLSYEGDALGLRVRALREIGGRRLEHVFVLRAHDPISPRVTREGETRALGEIAVTAAIEQLQAEIAATGQPPIVLLIIDTVRASLAGSEDNSEAVAAYLRAVRRLMRCVPSAACILAHHAGWQDGEQQRKRERGSSAWRGNVDVTLYLEAGEYDAVRGEAELILRALKVRDAERPAPLHMVRRRVELLEMDRLGGPVTSCLIEPDRRTRQDREADAAAAVDQEQRDVDLRTLRAIVEHPEATSHDRLRLVVGARKTVIGDSVSRLVRAGWVRLPERQRQPYVVTDAGRAALEADA